MPSALKNVSIFSLQERPDVFEFHIAGCIARTGVGGEQVLPCAFRDGDHGVRLFEHPLLQRGEEDVQFEGHLGDEREVHILARDDCAGGDEARVAAHQFYKPDATRHAARFGVRAIQHAGRLLDGAEKAKCARDKTDIVINRLRDADDREPVAALARLLKKLIRAALRAVAAHGEKNVHAAGDEIVHRAPDVHRSARRTENGAALLMNPVHELGRDFHRLDTARRIESAVSAAKTEHFAHAVTIVQLEKERSDDVVQPRTQTAAGHDACARLLRIEEELRPRPGQLELKARLRANFDALGNADFVVGCVTSGEAEARFAEGGSLHG